MGVAPEVDKTLGDFVSEFNSGDSTAIAALFASTDDVLGIGTDPKEWWRGRATLMRVLEAQMKEMSGARLDISEKAGAGSWVAAQCSIGMPGGPATPARLTIVCTGDGLIEHFHLSVGAANEDVIGQTLTT